MELVTHEEQDTARAEVAEEATNTIQVYSHIYQFWLSTEKENRPMVRSLFLLIGGYIFYLFINLLTTLSRSVSMEIM